MGTTYAVDVIQPSSDSLEGVMGQIYTDLFNPVLEAKALTAFRALMRLFNQRLATTTNSIEPTNKRLLYRIVSGYLSGGIAPEELSIVTFNQDLQAEKSLHLMSTVGRWSSRGERIFNFPGLYGFPTPPDVTSPTRDSTDVFPQSSPMEECARLLKLHGSLNWYSTHSTRYPTTTAMFKQTRKLRITQRRNIDPTMTLTGKQRRMYTLPVIVPPVTHKSAVLHKDVGALWTLSEACLREADELVVFGYSCPALDFESANQLRRSQLGRSDPPTISIINPDHMIPSRFISLLDAKRLHYYDSAHEFLKRHIGGSAAR